jgi:carbonic anhydrase/acetyltransferase-like protein (isoleucine patch superfamily)
VWIGYDVIIETSHPHLVTIHDRAGVGIRSTIIAHNREQRGVVIEEDAVLGPEAIVLPNVTIGREAIVTAGSVVTKSVSPKQWCRGTRRERLHSLKCPWDWMCLSKNSPKAFDQLRRHLPIIRRRAASSVA